MHSNDEKWPARSGALGALGVAALVVLAWRVRILRPSGEAMLAGGDVRQYFYPFYDTAYSWLAAGVLPLWNPYQLCGMPWLAALQGGFFYPPHVLYLFLPTRIALAASALLHLILISLWMVALARRLGLTAGAAMLAAVLFTIRGNVPLWVAWPCLLEAVAWLPLGALGVVGIARGGGSRSAAVLALAMGASCLAGGAQATAFLLYAWSTLLLALLLGRQEAGARSRRLAVFAYAIAVGGLAGAIQLLPALELSRVGLRATHVLSPTFMLGLDTPGTRVLREAVTGSPRSFGVIGLALVPFAFGARPHRPYACWAATVGCLAFLFALGPTTPLFRVYRLLPMLGWFRTPTHILVLADFCFALLAAIGLDAITGPLAKAGRAGGVVSALVALAVAEVFLAPRDRTRLPYDAATVALYRTHEQALRRVGALTGGDRIWMPFGLGGLGLAPKLASRYGLRSVEDYEQLAPRRQAEYFTYLSAGAEGLAHGVSSFDGHVGLFVAGPERRLTTAPLAARRRLLDLAAVRFVLVEEGLLALDDVPALIVAMGLEPRPSPGPGLALFENSHALPRAFIVHRVRAAPPADDLLERLSQDGFDPLAESYVEGSVDLPDASVPVHGEVAEIARDDQRVVELVADLPAPGLLVLADAYYPGWRATVDGDAAPIVATNKLFRGVVVPAGAHRIRFVYSPWTVKIGALSSLLATVVIGVMLAR